MLMLRNRSGNQEYKYKQFTATSAMLCEHLPLSQNMCHKQNMTIISLVNLLLK